MAISDYLKDLGSLLVKPSSFFEKLSGKRMLKNCLLITVVFIVIHIGIRLFLYTPFQTPMDFFMFPVNWILGSVAQILILIISAAAAGVLNVILKLFDAKKGYNLSLVVYLYGLAPLWLIGWIPVSYVIYVATLWAFLIQTIGIRERKEIGYLKASIGLLWLLISDILIASLLSPSLIF